LPDLRVKFIFKVVAALCGALVLGGCAGSIERWIVNTRVHQGDVALLQGSVRDAATSYRLALRVDPNDAPARAGFVKAAAELARLEFSRGSFDDALATVDGGLAVDSQSAALAALKATIDQAKLKREIVVSNYPTYRATGLEIARAYQQFDATDALLRRDLRRFSYTFDTDDLTSAIKRSYELELELAKDTNRLIVYRQLVSSGVPEVPSQSTTFGAASLLPLP
jgi:tetratricopeptide (TPR) repeat protein